MEDDQAPRIAEGFPGQRAVVLPRPVIASWLNAAPLLELSPSDVGHYPHARWHHRERPDGSPELIFLWCFQGEGWLTLAGETFPIHPGQAAVIPPGVPHVYGADHASPWTIYWVHAVGPKIGEVQRLLGARLRQPILTLGQDPGLASLFEQMLSLCSSAATAPRTCWELRSAWRRSSLASLSVRTGRMAPPNPPRNASRTSSRSC